jgi:uracil phosphoribosyltransferase
MSWPPYPSPYHSPVQGGSSCTSTKAENLIIRGGGQIVRHPLVQHKLTIMRDKHTSTADFRRLLREISLLLCYEVTRPLTMHTVEIETPLEKMVAPSLAGKKLVFASILRAGNGLLEGMLDLVPSARVAHIGLYRDHDTLEAIEYYYKAPTDLGKRLVVVVDPMLATANSAIEAVQKLKDAGAEKLRFLCLLSAPEGVQAFTEAHPDVPIVTAAIDSHLNDKGYIVPGLGDAGDRMYGTK